jgi:hypothetical protein
MIYSHFNWGSGRFDYYNAPGDQMGNRPKHRIVLNEPNSKHGVPVESLVPVIPSGARRVGSGKQAKGRIAVLPNEVMSPRGEKKGGAMDTASGLGGFEGLEDNPLIHSPWLTLGLWFGAFMLGYKVVTYVAKS